jgi:hypothetical protein
MEEHRPLENEAVRQRRLRQAVEKSLHAITSQGEIERIPIGACTVQQPLADRFDQALVFHAARDSR